MRVACVRRPQGTGAPAGRRKVCPQAHCVTDRAEDVQEEKGYERRQGRLSRELGHTTYNMSAVRCSF